VGKEKREKEGKGKLKRKKGEDNGKEKGDKCTHVP
jgi:hypothetical protein